jgi:hypothetical protein
MADQPEVVIVGQDGTEHVFPPGFDPKRAAAIVSGQRSSSPAGAAEPSTLSRLVSSLPDVGVGAVKGATNTALDAGQLVRKTPMYIPGVGLTTLQAVTDALGNLAGGAAGKLLYGHDAGPVNGDQAFAQARQATTATNTPQTIGKALESVAELATPVAKGVEALPSAARAGRTFQDVMGAAAKLPVDVEGPGEAALRIQQLAERGGSMPMAVRKLLNRITAPNSGPLTYEEARDFASNISRLSADEYGRLTPVVAREVANLRVALNKAIGDTASAAGKGAEYAQAMQEYARAMKLRDALSAAWEGVKKGVAPIAGAGGGAYWLTKAVRDAISGN